MSIKMLREALCQQSVRAEEWPSDVRELANELIALIDLHRPLGPDGKHGDRHTISCGCEL